MADYDYATLAQLFPRTSRVTRWRWRTQRKVRDPDITINGIDYWRTDVPLRPEGAPEKRKAVPPHQRKAAAKVEA